MFVACDPWVFLWLFSSSYCRESLLTSVLCPTLKKSNWFNTLDLLLLLASSLLSIFFVSAPSSPSMHFSRFHRSLVSPSLQPYHSVVPVATASVLFTIPLFVYLDGGLVLYPAPPLVSFRWSSSLYFWVAADVAAPSINEQHQWDIYPGNQKR